MPLVKAIENGLGQTESPPGKGGEMWSSGPPYSLASGAERAWNDRPERVKVPYANGRGEIGGIPSTVRWISRGKLGGTVF